MVATTLQYTDHPATRGGLAPGSAELALATSLYQALACGHDRLAFNVAGGFALWRRGARGRLEPLPNTERVPAGEWRPSLEVGEDGTTIPRRFNPWVLAGHVRGHYDVAANAPSWCGWLAFDLDAPIAREVFGDDSDEVIPSAAVDRAIADRDRRLGELWRVLGLGPGRLPVIVQTPGLGLHVWLPLARRAGDVAGGGELAELTWPAAEIVERAAAVLHRHGVTLAGGRLELYPAGRPLRAPCGRRTLLLDVAAPNDADHLGLSAAPGTTATRHETHAGERYARTVRRPWAMVAAFLERWRAARRPLDEWLGDGRAWSPVWGPFEHPDRAAVDAPGDRKNRGAGASGGDSSSQHIDEVQGAAGARAGEPVGQGGRRSDARGLLDPSRRSGSDPRSSNPSWSISGRSASPTSPGAAIASPLRKGSAFREHLAELLRRGVVVPSTRHDAVLSLVFWWHVAGKTEAQVRAELEAWARAHPHVSRLRGERFVKTCLREGMHYYHRIKALPQRARALVRTVTRCRALAPADFLVLAKVREDVRDVAHAILEYLAGHADRDGRVGQPVTLGRAQLDALVFRDVRIVENGQRRRAEVIAVEELERLGVLTLHVDYSTGHHGRMFSCWYQFGSGLLAMPREPGSYERSRARQKAPADALVVGERQLREGTLRVLSAGTRGPPVVELEPVATVVTEDVGGGRWWRDMFEGRRFTVAEFFDADEAVVIAGPWSRPPPAPPRYGALVEHLPVYGRPARVGSYDPTPAIAATPAAPADPLAELAELAVDVEQLGDLDPEIAALAARALQTIVRRR